MAPPLATCRRAPRSCRAAGAAAARRRRRCVAALALSLAAPPLLTFATVRWAGGLRSRPWHQRLGSTAKHRGPSVLLGSSARTRRASSHGERQELLDDHQLLEELGVLIEVGPHDEDMHMLRAEQQAERLHHEHQPQHAENGGHEAMGEDDDSKGFFPGAKAAALSVATSWAVALLGSKVFQGKASSRSIPEPDQEEDFAKRAEAAIKAALRSVGSSVSAALLGRNLLPDDHSAQQPETHKGEEWWGPARDSVAEAATAAADAVDAAVTAATGSVTDTAAAAADAANEAVLAVEAAAADAASASPGAAELPAPEIPGMEEANVVLQVLVEPQDAQAMHGKQAGVARLMAKSKSEILGTMAKDGWEVEVLDEAKGVFELRLPPVRFPLPMGVVTIPPPRFRTTFRDSAVKDGEYMERGQADMVLQNGRDICSVELGFPFSKTFSVSAAGWGRAAIGWEGDTVRIACDIQAGLEIPRVPGLRSIMELFVRTYLKDSVLECSAALARGADELVEETSFSIEEEVATNMAEA